MSVWASVASSSPPKWSVLWSSLNTEPSQSTCSKNQSVSIESAALCDSIQWWAVRK